MIPDDMKIVVFDDEEDLRRDWEERLAKVVGRDSLQKMNGKDIEPAIEQLKERRVKARDPKEEFEKLEDLGDSFFDDITIFLVDFDLLESTNLSGEDIAYLVRCYSKCDVIVALNQFGDKTFDLTLQGHPESFADLNIGAEYFDSPGLWSRPEEWPAADFRPSVWPILPNLVRDFRQRTREASSALDDPVLEFLGLTEDDSGVLPRATLDFIDVKDRPPGSITLEDFVLRSGQGLRRKDKTAKEGVARIAAARIHKWLERFVLGGQDILVSAPHLVARLPSLLSGAADRSESWDATVSFDEVGGLTEDLVADFRFGKTTWLSRPAWYWHKVRELGTEIPEVKEPWTFESPPFIFCEDLSRFRPGDDLESFSADLPSPFTRRFVAKLPEIDYRPTTRLLD